MVYGANVETERVGMRCSELRVVAVASSARRRGNCQDIAEAILAKLRGMGVETELIRTVDYEINPCNRCSYECFREEASSSCPR